MTKTCYSCDEEYFEEDEESPLERAVESFLEDNEDFVGETEIQIFEGEQILFKISDFLGINIAYVLAETAVDSDYGGENAEGWASKIIRLNKEIQEAVAIALEVWANQTNNQPNFFGVKNIKPYFVKVSIDKEGSWDIVSE